MGSCPAREVKLRTLLREMPCQAPFVWERSFCSTCLGCSHDHVFFCGWDWWGRLLELVCRELLLPCLCLCCVAQPKK